MKISKVLLILLGVLLLSSYIWAQDDDREEFTMEEIVVTGVRVTQGGAQDINFFRGETMQERIPHPDSFTAEGLLSGYDLTLPTSSQCDKLFCLVGEAMPVSFIAQPEAEILLELGFASNLEEKNWKRSPLNLVAVVDKSGSMDGTPLELVRYSLENIIKQMQPEDQLSIVLYGDQTHVYLPTTKLSSTTRKDLVELVRAIESAGSTNMEAGLRLGYQVAGRSASNFSGLTRVIQFTDEQPNVGATDADSFMGMAIAASKQGIGLTTIGVGIQFDAVLGTKISSVRGGNSFFIREKKDSKELFEKEFDYMVSELAHDLKIAITPNEGYRVASVYGIPGELLGWQDEKTVTVTVPTVFFSTKGGGIFIALGREPNDRYLPKPVFSDGHHLADVNLSYLPYQAHEPVSDALQVAMSDAAPSKAMRMGALLVDEFTVLREATSQHHLHHNPKAAYKVLNAMSSRLQQANESLLKPEVELVEALEKRFAFLSGYASEEALKSNKNKFVSLWGFWEIYRLEGQVTLYKKDVIQFTPDDYFRVRRGKSRENTKDEEETYRANNDQIYLDESELLFTYRANKERLVLTHEGTGVRVYARKLLADE